MGNKLTKEQFVERANKIHNFKYDYTKVIYINTYTKVNIICAKHNNEYWQLPSNHLSGHGGCKTCAEIMRQKTCQTKYGCNHQRQSKKVQEKTRQTNLEKYGVEYAIASRVAREKSKQTMQTRYGCDYAQQSTIILQKTKDTNLKNYGVENVFQSEEIKEKSKQANLEKYGCIDPGNTDKFRQKARQTSLERFGVEYHEQLQISTTSLKLLKNVKYLKEEHYGKEKPLCQIAKELNVSYSTIIQYFKKYNITPKLFNRSMGENEVSEFIESMGYVTILNSRSILKNNLEIDIYIPEINKALEYNGLYYHKGRGVNYHINKTGACKEIGIQLIHIWEDQWNDNTEGIKNNIINFLNNQPQQPLNEQIEIDLATDNTQFYVGYKIQSQTKPKLYSEDVWDCGTMILCKK